MPNSKRIATVVIHGMGEQNPMGTMSGFVKSFLAYEEYKNLLTPGQNYFSTPTDVGDSYEVQKWIVKKTDYRPRVDFFELYWAPLMTDNQFSHVFPWMKKILFMKSKNWRLQCLKLILVVSLIAIPILSFGWVLSISKLFYNHFIDFGMINHFYLILFTALIIGFSVLKVKSLRVALGFSLLAFSFYGYYSIDDIADTYNSDSDKWKLIIGTLICIGYIFKFTGKFLKEFLADAARYFEPQPNNVKNRDEIRQLGVSILESISLDDSYDRIIIVSHSLGSAVGYDILRLYWAKHGGRYHLDNADRDFLIEYQENMESVLYCKKEDNKNNDLVGKEVCEDSEDKRCLKYQKIQNNLFNDLSTFEGKSAVDKLELRWKISDFITTGSPLSKMKIFYSNGKDTDEWVHRFERTIVTNPPTLDLETDGFYFTKDEDDGPSKGSHRFHHGSLFAFTRWTNIFHRTDLIGGNISQVIGKGTLNINLEIPKVGNPFNLLGWFHNRSPLMHSHYWSNISHRNKLKGEPSDKQIMENELDKTKFEKDLAFGAIEKIYNAMHLHTSVIKTKNV